MIYNFLSFILWLISLPFLLILTFKEKYKYSLPARFFLLNNSKLKPCDVCFHACSFGEVEAITPLINSFENVAITTITNTGFKKAKQLTSNSAFLPYEMFLPFWLSNSKVLIIFEAELWLNLAKYAKKNGSYVILLNARINDKSYKNYKKFSFYYKSVFKYIDLILAQSDVDKQRLEELGGKNIKVVGNIKGANFKGATKEYKKFDKKFIVIASTHENEEELILSNLIPNKNQKFLLAPRHPERFEKVGRICEEFCKKYNLTFEKFSQNENLSSDFILLDILGELINFYKIANVVILGGSFLKGIGGHNPIEIAQFNVPIINGEYFHNQKVLFNLVEGVNFSNLLNLNELLNKNLNKTKIKQIYDIKLVENLIKEKI